jgi:hypothetical protein
MIMVMMDKMALPFSPNSHVSCTLHILCGYALVEENGSGRGDVGIIWNLGMVDLWPLHLLDGL